MRSRKSSLERVVAGFEKWRETRRERRIPEPLWDAALDLLGEYSASTICRELGLNPSRFKQIGDARKRVPRNRQLGQRGIERAVARRAVARRPSGSTGHDGFVELPSLMGLAVGGGATASPTVDVARQGRSGCRLTLESAAGTLSLTTVATPDSGWIDAVCRLALDVVKDGSRA